MGYLTVKGRVMTYFEYKEYIEKYRINGLKQFINIYNAHKDRFIEREHLHWGEEIEYTLFYFDLATEKV